jgi:hypothetical protein
MNDFLVGQQQSFGNSARISSNRTFSRSLLFAFPAMRAPGHQIAIQPRRPIRSRAETLEEMASQIARYSRMSSREAVRCCWLISRLDSECAVCVTERSPRFSDQCLQNGVERALNKAGAAHKGQLRVQPCILKCWPLCQRIHCPARNRLRPCIWV